MAQFLTVTCCLALSFLIVGSHGFLRESPQCQNVTCNNGGTCVPVGEDAQCQCVSYEDYSFYGTYCDNVVCGGAQILTDVVNFTSPGYREGQYPNNADCLWRISDNTGETVDNFVSVIFDKLRLNNPIGTRCGDGDFLRILDENTILATYCDEKMPTVIEFQKGMKPTVEFRSDKSGTDAGFYAQITKKTGCDAISCLNGGTCHQNGTETKCLCVEPWNGVLCEKRDAFCEPADSGSFRSPHFPDSYAGGTECLYKLQVAEGYRVVLTFNDVHLDDDNFIQVYDGADTTAFEYKRIESNPNGTSRIYQSSGNYMTVRLNSTDFGAMHQGFRADYRQERTVTKNLTLAYGDVNTTLDINTTRYFLHNFDIGYNIFNPMPTLYNSLNVSIRAITLNGTAKHCQDNENFLAVNGLGSYDKKYCGGLTALQHASGTISGVEQFHLKLHIGQSDGTRNEYFVVHFQFWKDPCLLNPCTTGQVCYATVSSSPDHICQCAPPPEGFSCQKSCDRTITLNRGNADVITSPHYPSAFANETECVWTIATGFLSLGNSIRIDLQILGVEGTFGGNCTTDYIEVRYGALGPAGELIGRYCGVGHITLTSYVSTMWVKWHHSKGIVRGGGFIGKLSLVDRVAASYICRNGGTPVPIGGSGVANGYKCSCAKGFRGSNCEIDIYCWNNPCLNHATCNNTGSGYDCICLNGFAGKNCDALETPETVYPAPAFGRFRPVLDSFTHEYPINADEHWLANFTNGQVNIRLPAIEYSANCDRDYVEVIVGDADGKSNTLGPYCGSTHPPTIYNPVGTINVHFHSDYMVNRLGFYAHYSLGTPSCDNYCENEGKCLLDANSVDCVCFPGFGNQACSEDLVCRDAVCLHGGICQHSLDGSYCKCPARFTGQRCETPICGEIFDHKGTGVISSNFPEDSSYADMADCTWVIKESSPIRYYFQKFSLNTANESDCAVTGDRVIVDDGIAPKTFCGSSVSSDFFNGSATTTVQFVSNPGSRGQGFELVFERTPFDSISCEGVCVNGGTCSQDPETKLPTCSCHTNFSGQYCQYDHICGENPCQNGGTCVHRPSENSFRCECPSYATGTFCSIVKCGGDFTGSMDGLGPIRSPNYPNRYPKRSDCDWTFRLQDGDKITFDVSDFEVEPLEQLDCAYDYLTISFCNDTDFCQPINAAKTNYCGTKPFSVAFDIKKGTDDKTPYVKLHFESDDRLQFKGFSINVKTELNDLCEGFCFNGGICSIVNGVAGCDCRTGTLGNRCEVDTCCSNCPSYSTCNHVDCSCVCPANFSGDSCQTYPTCGGTITLDRPGKGGVIKSLLYPNGCAPNESCKYTFDFGIEGYSVQLDFTSSFLQCGSQPSVTITDGTTRAVYDICGTFTSKHPLVTLEWSTGPNFSKDCGFSVKYTKIETNQCYNYECLHGGTCVSSFLKPSCTCLIPYFGDHCENFEDRCATAGYVCLPHGKCVNDVTSYHCECFDNYTGDTCHTAPITVM